MKKLAIFIRGGIGDRYAFFACLPAILERFDLTVDELLVMLDSSYGGNSPENNSCNAMLEARNITDVILTPPSDRGPVSFTAHENEYGFDVTNMSDPTFLPYRGPIIKAFVRNIMQQHNITRMIDFPIREEILYWDGEKQNKLTDLKRVPFSFVPKEKFTLWDTDNTVLVHCSPLKYKELPIFDTPEVYINTVRAIPQLKFVLVGHVFGTRFSGNIIDLRDKLDPKQLFDGILYTKNALMTGANFAFHRLLSDKNSTFIWPYRFANPSAIFSKIYFDTSKMIFINSHAPIDVKQVISAVNR